MAATSPTDRAVQRPRWHLLVICSVAAVATLVLTAWLVDVLPGAGAPTAGTPRAGAVTAAASPALATAPVTMEDAAASLSSVRQDLHKVALSADDLIKLLEALELNQTDPQRAAAAREP